MVVLVRMQFHCHVDTQPVKRFARAMRCIHDIKVGMLQVRTNEISLRKCSGGSAHLRTLEGTLVTSGSARFDNNNSEPKSHVRLLSYQKKDNFLKTHVVESILSFSQCQNENECFFAKRQLQTTKWKNTKINCKTTGEVSSQIWPFQELKPCLAFLANPFNAEVSVMAVQFANRLLQTCLL